jgi:hypothetical protein
MAAVWKSPQKHFQKSKLMMMFYRVAPAATTHKLFETGKKKKTRGEDLMIIDSACRVNDKIGSQSFLLHQVSEDCLC